MVFRPAKVWMGTSEPQFMWLQTPIRADAIGFSPRTDTDIHLQHTSSLLCFSERTPESISEDGGDQFEMLPGSRGFLITQLFDLAFQLSVDLVMGR